MYKRGSSGKYPSPTLGHYLVAAKHRYIPRFGVRECSGFGPTTQGLGLVGWVLKVPGNSVKGVGSMCVERYTATHYTRYTALRRPARFDNPSHFIVCGFSGSRSIPSIIHGGTFGKRAPSACGPFPVVLRFGGFTPAQGTARRRGGSAGVLLLRGPLRLPVQERSEAAIVWGSLDSGCIGFHRSAGGA